MGTRGKRMQDKEKGVRAWARRVLANSGAGGESFAEPRGWALKWDGESLPDDSEVEDEEAPPHSEETS